MYKKFFASETILLGSDVSEIYFVEISVIKFCEMSKDRTMKHEQ